MRFVIRGVAALVTLLATQFFVYWVSVAVLHGRAISVRAIFAGALIAAIGAAVYVWRATASLSGGLSSYILTGALLVGAVGFVAGFFGPIIFVPGANQGPLLGIFITGPAVFLLGSIAGGVYWHMRRRRAAGSTPDA